MRLPVRLTPQHPARKVAAGLLIGFFAVAVAIALHHSPGTSVAMSGLDNTLYDAFYHFRKPSDRTTGPIVIVTADDSTMEQMARHKIRWPYPRSLWGGAAQYVESQHARAVVFDITFQGPTSDDEDFADQLDSIRIPLILGTRVTKDGKPEIFSPKLKKPPVFGAVNILNDKVIRDYQPIVHATPSLALRTIQMLGVKTPVWASSAFRLHYYGPTEAIRNGQTRFTYQYVPAWAVFTASQAPEKAAALGLAPDMFRDKIVLFGYTSAGMYDLKSSPLSALYPGVEVHATAIDNLLNGQVVMPVSSMPAALIALVSCCVAGMGVLLPRRVTLKLAACLAATAIFVLGAVLIFTAEPICWLPMSTPIVALVMAIVIAFAWSYLTEDRQRRLVVKALSQYVSPEVAAEIERNPAALKLGGQRREMTVLFSDIQGFTDLSESMESEKLSALLNYYLGEMSELILSNNGTLDKYIGDAIMAFWSAPIAQADHAARACRAALAMREREKLIQPELAAFGAAGLLTRIGINTGPMVFGNMGSARKFNYSVLGDSVNLGSRLEGANKFYGSRILIAESTAKLITGQFVVRQLDVLRVKGKLKPLAVFELICEAPPQPVMQRQIDEYTRAFSLYQAQNWDEAQAVLQDLLQHCPDDQPVAALLQRVGKLRQNPPPPGWDGVYVATDK